MIPESIVIDKVLDIEERGAEFNLHNPHKKPAIVVLGSIIPMNKAECGDLCL